MGILIAGGRGNVVEGNVVLDSSIYGIAILPNLDDNLWLTRNNVVRNNIVRRSGQADLALGGPSVRGDFVLRDGNTFQTSLPGGRGGLRGVLGARGWWRRPRADVHPPLRKVVAALVGHYDPGDWRAAPAPSAQPSDAGRRGHRGPARRPEDGDPGPA